MCDYHCCNRYNLEWRVWSFPCASSLIPHTLFLMWNDQTLYSNYNYNLTDIEAPKLTRFYIKSIKTRYT